MTAPVTPTRIVLSRTAGWRLPDGARSVARPTRWGNPFAVRELPGGDWTVIDINDRSAALREEPPALPDKWAATVMAVRLFELHTNPAGTGLYVSRFYSAPNHLAGRDLACWCPLQGPDGTPWPCHADWLLRLAN